MRPKVLPPQRKAHLEGIRRESQQEQLHRRQRGMVHSHDGPSVKIFQQGAPGPAPSRHP